MIRQFFKSRFSPPPAAPFQGSPEVRASINKDGVVFLHPRRGRVFSANRFGAQVWESLTNGEDLDEVSARIAAEYSVPREQVRRDAEVFVGQLQSAGLIEVARN